MTPGKLQWSSKNPINYREGLMAYFWGAHWFKLPAAERPKFGLAKLSKLVTNIRLLAGSGADNNLEFKLTLGTAKWGCVACPLVKVPDSNAAEPWQVFQISRRAEIIYITDPSKWNVYPFEACVPKKLQDHAPGAFPNRMRIRITGLPTSLLKTAFAEKVNLKMVEMAYIMSSLGIETPTGRKTRQRYIELISNAICKDDNAVERDAFVKHALEVERKPKPDNEASNPSLHTARNATSTYTRFRYVYLLLVKNCGCGLGSHAVRAYAPHTAYRDHAIAFAITRAPRREITHRRAMCYPSRHYVIKYITG
jgi:hypothetical protein